MAKTHKLCCMLYACYRRPMQRRPVLHASTHAHEALSAQSLPSLPVAVPISPSPPRLPRSRPSVRPRRRPPSPVARGNAIGPATAQQQRAGSWPDAAAQPHAPPPWAMRPPTQCARARDREAAGSVAAPCHSRVSAHASINNNSSSHVARSAATAVTSLVLSGGAGAGTAGVGTAAEAATLAPLMSMAGLPGLPAARRASLAPLRGTNAPARIYASQTFTRAARERRRAEAEGGNARGAGMRATPLTPSQIGWNRSARGLRSCVWVGGGWGNSPVPASPSRLLNARTVGRRLTTK
eukprot:363645-Chlamydomonas_euryale.AAC.2